MAFKALDASTFLHESAASLPLTILVPIALLTVFAYCFLLAQDPEAPVAYNVVAPEPVNSFETWSKTAQLIEEPSLKIPNSTLLQCYAPATGKILGRVNPTTADGIDRAIARAEEAQKEWAKTTFAGRRRVLKTLLKYILEHQDDIVRAACLDSGKPRVDASLGEVLVTVEKLQWTIKHGEKALRTEKRPTNLLLSYKHNEVRWEPLGVVAALVSWNYPFHNLLNPIISSIFAGNAVLVKSSEATAWSAQYFVSIARGALTACGHDSALIQSITCWPSVAPHLTSHPSISHITFIGSRQVAHHIASAASKSLTPLCLELGGKDPAIILDGLSEAKLQQISSILMRGVFQSAGQNCIGIERVIALPSSYDRLESLILPRVQSLRLGSALDDEESVDVGACISPTNFDRLESLIADAVSRGARLLAGGKRFDHPQYPRGHYFAPAMIVDVTADMAIAQTELFAPVFLLMRARDVRHAVEIANGTEYALGASVFGSAAAELEFVTTRLKAGMVSVNDFASYYLCSLPFGGVAGSGYGRFGGEEGLRSLCNVKSVQRDRFPAWMGIGTSIPPRLDYVLEGERRKREESGEKDGKRKAWEFVKGIVEVGYGMTLWAKVVGVGKILRNL